ncbi:MAG: hypothetical protein SynsKO_20930 [Synoicihabitans sp.]
MSLINDALKKAQKQRAKDEAARAGKVPPPGAARGADSVVPPEPPKPPAPPSAAPEPEPDPLPPKSVLQETRKSDSRAFPAKWIGVGLVVLIVLPAGFWFLGKNSQEATVETVRAESGPPTKTDPIEPKPSSSPEVALTAGAPESVPLESPSDSATPQTPVATSAPIDEPTISVNDTDRSAETAVTMTSVAEPQKEPEVQFVYEERSQPGRIAEVVVDQSSGADSTPRSTANELSVEERSVPSAVSSVPELAEERQSPQPQSKVVDTNNLNPRSDPTTTDDSTSVASSPAGGSVVILSEEASSSIGTSESAVSTARPDAAVVAFLESARVTGVRASATDPKVLMNNRVYRLNDVVSRDLQLRVTFIESRELKFTDSQGFVYTKQF